MIRLKTVTAVLLCLFLLAGCAQDEPIPSTAAPTAPQETQPIDAALVYSQARQALEAQKDLVIEYTVTQVTTVGGESYTQTRTGTGSYLSRNTESMQAHVQEQFATGSYTDTYTESYIDGVAFSTVNDTLFRCDMTAEAFLTQQISGVLLDETHYGTLTATALGSNTVITFTQPLAAEAWLQLDPQGQLVSATGSATVDAGGALINSQYRLEYTLGSTVRTMEITASARPETPDLSALEAVDTSDAAAVSHLQIPRQLLRTVGQVYTAEKITANYSDTLYSEVFGLIRTQSSTVDTYGSGAEFMAALTTQVSVTEYPGGTSTNANNIIFRDGVYSSSLNGGDPVTNEAYTADQVRMLCEDAILSSLIITDYISSAQLEDNGDFICIRFTGNDRFADAICNSIYSMLRLDVTLESWADSYTTDAVTAYLTVNKYTGLPTAMGFAIGRTHVIDKVPYSLTYQLDESIFLSSSDAYENITGEPDPAAASKESAAPLFYKVTGVNGQTMYLLGTIHAGDGRTANLPKALTDAFAASDALAVEFDTFDFESAVSADPVLQQAIVQCYYYTDSTVADHLSAELYALLEPMILASGSNNHSAPALKVIIWESLIQELYRQQSYSLTPSLGMDNQLLRWAKAQEKPVYEIESGIAQLEMLAGFSEDLQALLLEQTLRTPLLTYGQDLLSLYELWCQGDEAALTQALAEDTAGMTEQEQKLYAEYTAAMFNSRNQVMHTAAVNYLESGETVFYAVGLAHLLGENGLVESLINAGYTVEVVSQP